MLPRRYSGRCTLRGAGTHQRRSAAVGARSSARNGIGQASIGSTPRGMLACCCRRHASSPLPDWTSSHWEWAPPGPGSLLGHGMAQALPGRQQLGQAGGWAAWGTARVLPGWVGTTTRLAPPPWHEYEGMSLSRMEVGRHRCRVEGTMPIGLVPLSISPPPPSSPSIAWLTTIALH